jgi:hypothetical protein
MLLVVDCVLFELVLAGYLDVDSFPASIGCFITCMGSMNEKRGPMLGKIFV